MSTETITPERARALILGSSGRLFSVTFYRKTAKRAGGITTAEVNDPRTMRAILGERTRKGLAGGPSAYRPQDHGLVWVYTMAGDQSRKEDARFRRSIPTDAVTSLTLGGVTYNVTGSPWPEPAPKRARRTAARDAYAGTGSTDGEKP